MKSRLLKLLTVVFAVALIAPAFTAVESVKVGGDIQVWGVLRSDFDVDGNEDVHFFQSAARVYVTAELSENVVATIRLLHEKTWFGPYSEYLGSWWEDGIRMDLANIKISDLFTPGLSLTVGRQEIQLGEGLVVGSAYNVWNYPNNYPYYSWGDRVFAAPDLGLAKSFDAVRIDYASEAVPVNVTAFLSKILENVVDEGDDDETLYGLNLGFNAAEVANIDVYWVRVDGIYGSDGNLDTAGLRVVGTIPAVSGLTLKGEYARQFGDDGAGTDFEGSALLVGAEYKFATNMEPTVKVNYELTTGYSGGYDADAWIPVFPSNMGSRIGPLFYAYVGYNAPWMLATWDNPGLSIINAGVSFKPVEKVKVSLDGYLINLEEKLGNYDDVGLEIDLNLDYQLTEDVTVGLTLGTLNADDVIEYFGGDDTWQAILSMKVSF